MSVPKSDTDRKPFERIPKNVVPTHYNISLAPDLENLTFTGSEIITVEITSTTCCIVLNALELDVTKAYFEKPDVAVTALEFYFTFGRTSCHLFLAGS